MSVVRMKQVIFENRYELLTELSVKYECPY